MFVLLLHDNSSSDRYDIVDSILYRYKKCNSYAHVHKKLKTFS